MLSKFLEEHHHTVSSIHGGRMQTQREEALRSFKNGRTSILVATDIVVRGLDILYVCIGKRVNASQTIHYF